MRKGPVDHFRLAQDWTSASAALATKPDPWQDSPQRTFLLAPARKQYCPKNCRRQIGFSVLICKRFSIKKYCPQNGPGSEGGSPATSNRRRAKQTANEDKSETRAREHAGHTANRVHRYHGDARHEFIIAQFLAPDDGERDRSEVPVDRLSDSDGYRYSTRGVSRCRSPARIRIYPVVALICLNSRRHSPTTSARTG